MPTTSVSALIDAWLDEPSSLSWPLPCKPCLPCCSTRPLPAQWRVFCVTSFLVLSNLKSSPWLPSPHLVSSSCSALASLFLHSTHWGLIPIPGTYRAHPISRSLSWASSAFSHLSTPFQVPSKDLILQRGTLLPGPKHTTHSSLEMSSETVCKSEKKTRLIVKMLSVLFCLYHSGIAQLDHSDL